MKNKIMLALIALGTITAATPKITDIEISNLKQLPENVVKEMLPVEIGKEYTNKVSNDIYLSLLRSGLIQNVNVYPTQVGEEVKLKLVVDELPNAGVVYQNHLEIEKLKQKTEFVINNINIKGTKQNLNELIEKSGLKKGDNFSPYEAKVLESLIMSTGYFSSVSTQVYRSADEKSIDLEFNVVENPTITSVSIKGSTLLSEEDLKTISGLKVGDILNTNLLSPETSNILRAYSENGYLWTGFSDVSVTANGAVNIEIVEGKVAKVIYEKKGAVKEGQRINESDYKLKTQDFVLKRNTYLKKGQVLNQKELEYTISELFRTGLFSSINHELIQDQEHPDQLTVKIVLVERPTTAINGNISYSTEDSFSGGIKLSDSNFLGREEVFDLSGEAGIKGNYNLSLGFKDPWIQGTDRILAGGNIFFRKTTISVKDLDDYKKDPKEEKQKELEANTYTEPTDRQYIFGINGQIGKGLTNDLYLTVTPRLLNVYSKNKVADEKARVYQDYTLTSIGADLIYDTRDDRNTPKKGLYADLYVEGGYIFRENSLKFDENKRPIPIKETKDGKEIITGYEKQKTRAYATTTADLRAYHPVYEDKNSMAYRLLASYSHANTPVGQMSIVGDGVTLRGLPSTVSGNKYAVTFTAENRTYFNDYLQGVLFYDGGIAEKIVDSQKKLKFVNNLGLGARINTPIGVLRLDYAWNIAKGEKATGKFNFGFGQTF